MTLREKMARAMCTARKEDPDEWCRMELGLGLPGTALGIQQERWKFNLFVADACLRAMMEPTEAMQDAGNKTAEMFVMQDPVDGRGGFECITAWNDDGALNVWRAMLRAALEEK